MIAYKISNKWTEKEPKEFQSKKFQSKEFIRTYQGRFCFKTKIKFDETDKNIGRMKINVTV